MAASMNTQEAFFSQIVEGDDISWKAMILDAVRNHQMDPWDIDISFIATKFLELLKQYQEMNFRLSGKIIHASALMLKLKSTRFVSEDITLLDQLIASAEDQETPLDEEEFYQPQEIEQRPENVQIHKRTPQPRKRKVSVYDLIEALEKAIDVTKRRRVRQQVDAPDVEVPQKKFDISESMDEVHEQLRQRGQQFVAFSHLIASEAKDDKIFTFIPLLHLRNSQKIDLHQKQAFSDFDIEVLNQ